MGGVMSKFLALGRTPTNFGTRGGQRGAQLWLNMATKLPNTNAKSKQALRLIFDLPGHCFVLNYGFYCNKLFKNSLDCSLSVKVIIDDL